jgi:hypothetical protein
VINTSQFQSKHAYLGSSEPLDLSYSESTLYAMNISSLYALLNLKEKPKALYVHVRVHVLNDKDELIIRKSDLQGIDPKTLILTVKVEPSSFAGSAKEKDIVYILREENVTNYNQIQLITIDGDILLKEIEVLDKNRSFETELIA